MNYYHPHRVAAAADNATIPFSLVDPDPDTPTDEFGWPVEPAALTETLRTLPERFPGLPPLWVTENGTQDTGAIDDGDRVAFLTEHIAAVDAAVAAGVDVRGYLHWSLLDGWEFAEGLTRHFGLVAVDPGTADRSPKTSFAAYRDLDRRPPETLTGAPTKPGGPTAVEAAGPPGSGCRYFLMINGRLVLPATLYGSSGTKVAVYRWVPFVQASCGTWSQPTPPRITPKPISSPLSLTCRIPDAARPLSSWVRLSRIGAFALKKKNTGTFQSTVTEVACSTVIVTGSESAAGAVPCTG